MITIYAPVAGDLAQESLAALATVLGTSSFHTAIQIMMTLGVVLTGYAYIQRRDIKTLAMHFIRWFAVMFVLLGLKCQVQVIDMQNPMKPYQVDHVPAGVAIPGYFVSTIGRGVAQLFDDIFHTPDETDYSKTGLVFGSRVLLNSASVDLHEAPGIRKDLMAYTKQCVFTSKLLVSRSLTPKALVTSDNLKDIFFNSPSNIFRVILQDGRNLTCADAAPIVKKELQTATMATLKTLAATMTDGDVNKYTGILEGAYHHIIKMHKTGPEILAQNYLINNVRDAARDSLGAHGNTADMFNFNYTASQHKKRIAEANSWMMTAYNLPLFMSILWILSLCIFPLVALLSLLPTYEKVYFTYIKSLVYLWSWPPMFTVLHFFISYYTAHKVGKPGGITLANSDGIQMIQSDLALTAGYIASLIPFISIYLTKGMANAFSTAAQYIGGMDHSLSQGEATSSAMGNLSMGNASAWNMNYDNLSAHKHDTNATDFHGMSSHQLANGSVVTQTAGGQTLISTASGMSQLATNLHGSSRVAASLSENASHAQQQSSAWRTSADQHLSSGMSQMENFTSGDSQDLRSGGGVSAGTQDSFSQDYRTMQDAVTQYNSHHDKSSQVTLDEAARISVSTGKEGLGMVAKFLTGVSANASAGVSHSNTHSGHAQEFLNSSEGQSFHQAFNHVVNTAHSQHLDASSGHNLSASQQIAANLSKGSSLAHQSSAEFGLSQNYQQAASQVRESGASIDQNLSQGFTNWAMNTHGASAESVLAGTDSQSLATQQSWANQYYNSQAGKSAIAAQASSTLATARSGGQSAYGKSASAIALQSGASQGFDVASNAVANAKAAGHFEGMNKYEQAQAEKMLRHQAHSDLLKQSSLVEGTVSDHNNAGRAAIVKSHADRKQDYD